MRSSYRRGICRACGKLVALRLDGTVRGHGYMRNMPERNWCPGSLEKPTDVH